MGGEQHRVDAAPDLVGAVVGPVEGGGLEAEGVLEGDEVEQAPLGLGDEVGPVGGVEQLAGPGALLAPGRRMPARPVEREGQVQGSGDVGGGFFRGACRAGHAEVSLSSCPVRRGCPGPPHPAGRGAVDRPRWSRSVVPV